MVMVVRKVQLTGKMTFIVSLPKKWVRKVNINRGDPITITELNDGSLKIIPPTLGVEMRLPQGSIIKTFEGMENCTLSRKVIANYLTGYDFIKIEAGEKGFIKTEHRNVVRETAHELIGMDIIEQTAKEITIQCLLDYSKLPITQVMEKMRNIAVSMQEDAVASLLTGNIELAKDVIGRDREVDRLYLLAVKQLKDMVRREEIAKIMGISPRACLGYRVVIKCIERIADHAQKIAENVTILSKLNLPTPIRKGFLEMDHESRQVCTQAIEALLAINEEKAEEAIQLINSVEKAENTLIKEILSNPFDSYKSPILLKTNVDSLRRIADYGTDIAEIVLNLAAGELV